MYQRRFPSIVLTLRAGSQMYESEESGEILEEELAGILEIMLGVKEVRLSSVCLTLGPDTGKISYGKTLFLFVTCFKHFNTLTEMSNYL